MSSSSQDQDISGTTIIKLPINAELIVGSINRDETENESALREHTLDRKEFKIRLADGQGQRSSASMLIKKMYSWRGYESSFSLDAEPNRVTLVASTGDLTIATISIGFDSSSGLLADNLYRTELDLLRQGGRKLCEFTKLAVESRIRSKQVLAAIFHIAFIYAREIHGMTDLFIEVNPRHVKFYERMLGFVRLGEEKLNARVNAPAILLRLDLEFVREQVDRYGGKPDLGDSTRSLYPHGFSKSESAGIAKRLMLL
jgi:hypothetical protein